MRIEDENLVYQVGFNSVVYSLVIDSLFISITLFVFVQSLFILKTLSISL
jgi:hypothetical protein